MRNPYQEKDMKGYLNYMAVKVVFFFVEPGARVTYDRKRDFINVEA